MKNFVKSLLFTLAVMLIGMVSNAQTGSAYTFPVVLGDSLTTGDTVMKKFSVTNPVSAIGVQADIKKGTGTLDGKLYLFTSINGGNYVLTDSASFVAVRTFGTLNSTGGYTHTALISKAAPPGVQYIAAVTQTGSLTSSPVRVSYTARRY